MLNHSPGIKPSMIAGALWFAAIFMFGSISGTLRTLVTAPQIGEFASVTVEVPVMLGLGWLSCRWFVRKLRVPCDMLARLLMTLVFLGLLGVAETMLGTFVFGRPITSQIGALAQPAGMLGLAAQLITAGFPLLQRR